MTTTIMISTRVKPLVEFCVYSFCFLLFICFIINLAEDYGEYVMVRTPATLVIVIVVPCEKPAGYVSLATELSALT